MTKEIVFIVCFFGVVGIGVFMFFLLGIIGDICNYKRAIKARNSSEQG